MAETALTTTTQALAPSFGAQMQLQTLERALEFAGIVEKSGLAPKGLTREGIVIAMQMGYEVGLSPLQAIQNIASINGRPAIWGDAMLALVRASGLMESYAATLIGEPNTDGRGYRVTVKRVGNPEASDEFTVADARRAGLWGKPGPWTQYPQRMLMFRARGFILRDQFGDVLKGLKTVEEVQDEPRDITAEVEVHAPAAPSPESRLRKARETKPATVDATPADLKPVAKPATVDPMAPTMEQAQDALRKTGCPEGYVLDWLTAKGRLTKGQTLAHASPELLAYVIENAAKVAKMTGEWMDTQDERSNVEAEAAQ